MLSVAMYNEQPDKQTKDNSGILNKKESQVFVTVTASNELSLMSSGQQKKYTDNVSAKLSMHRGTNFLSR